MGDKKSRNDEHDKKWNVSIVRSAVRWKRHLLNPASPSTTSELIRDKSWTLPSVYMIWALNWRPQLTLTGRGLAADADLVRTESIPSGNTPATTTSFRRVHSGKHLASAPCSHCTGQRPSGARHCLEASGFILHWLPYDFFFLFFKNCNTHTYKTKFTIFKYTVQWP